MSIQNTNAGQTLNLFEVNLIAGQVAKLRRRQVLAHCGSMAALVLMGVAGVLFLVALTHLSNAIRHSAGIGRIESDLKQEEQLCDELNALRRDAIAQLGQHAPLVPFARARVNWAPKLAKLAESLPPGMGIEKIEGASGEVFVEPPQPVKPPDKGHEEKRTKDKGKERPKRLKPIEPPKMVFSVIYLPTVNIEEDPVGFLLEGLRGSSAFMRKMDFVRLEAHREEVWKGFKVLFFRGLLKGAPQSNET